jgi:hypothetical protein
MRMGAALVALALTGCPRLPPPAPRPHVHVDLGAANRDGVLTARLRIDHGERLRAVAVDWALVLGERDLVRGRSDSLAIPVRLPSEVQPGALVRLRGAVHFEGPDGLLFAPFDETVRIPR